jgi:hypothetical protein
VITLPVLPVQENRNGAGPFLFVGNRGRDPARQPPPQRSMKYDRKSHLKRFRERIGNYYWRRCF